MYIKAYVHTCHIFSNLNIWPNIFEDLTFKPASFYNAEKHGKQTLILKVNYTFCALITDCVLNAYQRI